MEIKKMREYITEHSQDHIAKLKSESHTERETKIISGFPGVGKSVLTQGSKHLTLDSDSSQFSWIEEGVRHPDFPNNYMAHIKENIGKADYILVSSHDNVRQALKKHDIFYTVVYPHIDLKDEYLERYRHRGNDEKFVEFIGYNWRTFIKEIENDPYPRHLRLPSGKYLSDVIQYI